jgi:hypothetical protein
MAEMKKMSEEIESLKETKNVKKKKPSERYD